MKKRRGCRGVADGKDAAAKYIRMTPRGSEERTLSQDIVDAVSIRLDELFEKKKSIWRKIDGLSPPRPLTRSSSRKLPGNSGRISPPGGR